MIEYLSRLLNENDGSLQIELWRDSSRAWSEETLVAVDSTGIVTRGRTVTHFKPWASVEHFRIRG